MKLPFRRILSARDASSKPSRPQEAPLPYSWILTSRLAIGPMPRTPAHWSQLEDAGFQTRFSCCYPEEEIFAPIPEHWHTAGVSLPDHREQEPLRPDRLALAVSTAQALLEKGTPLYLHCWAGRERSSLMAVGLVARQRGCDLFEALEWVRRCHPAASPIYDQLDVLEQILRESQGRSLL